MNTYGYPWGEPPEDAPAKVQDLMEHLEDLKEKIQSLKEDIRDLPCIPEQFANVTAEMIQPILEALQDKLSELAYEYDDIVLQLGDYGYYFPLCERRAG